MAGDWIKMRKNLPDDPAVIGISTQLSLDPDVVIGKLYRFWAWADTHSANGRYAHVTQVWLDSYLRAEHFASALESVGWLSIDESGISIPRFQRHMSQGAKKRALTNQRVALHRKKPCNARGVTKALPEKRREEKSNNSTNVELSPLPPSLDSEEFRSAWADWLAYRQERKFKTTEQTRKAQLATLAVWGSVVAVESLRTSIRQGWQGFFDPREKRPGSVQGGAQMRQLVDIDAMEFDP